MTVRTITLKEMTMVPPAPGKCQECAVDHKPDQPHDATSMFYMYKFYREHDEWPTWTDAMRHCSDEIKAHWATELTKMGIDIKSTSTRGN